MFLAQTEPRPPLLALPQVATGRRWWPPPEAITPAEAGTKCQCEEGQGASSLSPAPAHPVFGKYTGTADAGIRGPGVKVSVQPTSRTFAPPNTV